MLFSNKEQQQALQFIRSSDFDIFCLQEVPEEFLARLRDTFPNIVHTSETTRRVGRTHSTQHLVILSRTAISLRETPQLDDCLTASLPLRGQWFARLMYLSELWAEGVGNRHYLVAETALPNGDVLRICNVHLPLSSPSIRAREIELALEQCADASRAIFCGDFNVLESRKMILLNWLLGMPLARAFDYRRERTEMERRFAARGFHNPLRGSSTHPFSHSQLDHILISRNFHATKALAITDRYGSDHRPICVECA